MAAEALRIMNSFSLIYQKWSWDRSETSFLGIDALGELWDLLNGILRNFHISHLRSIFTETRSLTDTYHK